MKNKPKFLVLSTILCFLLSPLVVLAEAPLQLNQFETQINNNILDVDWDWSNVGQECFNGGVFSVYNMTTDSSIADEMINDYNTNHRQVSVVGGNQYSVYVSAQNSCDGQQYYNSSTITAPSNGGCSGGQDTPPDNPEGPGGSSPAPAPMEPSGEGQAYMAGIYNQIGRPLTPYEKLMVISGLLDLMANSINGQQQTSQPLQVNQFNNPVELAPGFDFKYDYIGSGQITNSAPNITVSGNQDNFECRFRKPGSDWTGYHTMKGTNTINVNVYGNNNTPGNRQIDIECRSSIYNPYMSSINYYYSPDMNKPGRIYNNNGNLMSDGNFNGDIFIPADGVDLYYQPEGQNKVYQYSGKGSQLVLNQFSNNDNNAYNPTGAEIYQPNGEEVDASDLDGLKGNWYSANSASGNSNLGVVNSPSQGATLFQ